MKNVMEMTSEFKKLFSIVPAMICIAGQDGYFKYLNPEWEKVLGFSLEELLSRPLFDFIHPDDHQATQKEIERQLNGKMTIKFENRYRCKDGSYKILEWRATPAEGERLYAVAQDVTEQKKNRQKTLSSEKKYRGLFNSIRDAILVADINRSIIDFNPAFIELFGYSYDEVIGKETLCLYEDEKQFQELGKALKDHYGKSPFLKTVNYMKKNGEVFSGETSVFYLKNQEGEVTGFIGLIRDITDRIKAERESLIFQTAIDQAPVGVALADEKINIYYCNPEGLGIRGGNIDDLVEIPKDAFKNWQVYMLNGEPYEVDNLPLVRAIRTGTTIREEFIVIHQDGSRHICDALACPVIENNKTIGGMVIFLDITDRKKFEESLKKSEERLNLVIRGSSDAPWDWDLIANNLYYSPQWWAQIGYTPGELPSDAALWQRLMHPDDYDRVNSFFQNALENGTESYEVEFRLLHKNGHYVPVLSRGFISKDNTGSPIRVSGTNMDLTELRSIEATLKKSEALHREAQRIAKIGHWELDSPTGTPIWSEEIFHIFGLDPKTSEPSFAAHEGIIHKDDWSILEKAISELSDSGKPFDLEFRIKRASGDIGWMHAIGSADKDEGGAVARMFGTAQDITDLKEAEEALRYSEEKYRTMMESFTEPLYICNPDFTVGYMNPAMQERIGCDTTEEPCYAVMHGLDDKCDWCVFDKIAEGKTVEINIESPLDNRHYRVTNMPIENPDGTFSKMTIFRDITDYMRAVSEKEKAQALLLQSQKLESIGSLAGGIAHDFNNILSSIIGFTELAIDDAPKDTHLEDSLQEVYIAGKRAKDLVKQILTFARESNEETKPVEISEIVQESIKLLRSSIPIDIEIDQNINTEAMVVGNPSLLQQVILNISSNSADAMEDEGGVLNITVSDIVVDEEFASDNELIRSGDYVQIIISDNGAGIPPDAIKSIFDPYFTTKEQGKGTGLGLATAYGTVKKYGGAINVESRLGKKTVFTVLLPSSPKSVTAGPYEPEELPGGKERLLFVDDETTIVKMGKQLLERLGYSVVALTSSVDALELFRTKPDEFDLVITDTTMPNMTGDKLAVELMKIRQDIPVIICTGYSKKISEETASQIGIKAFSRKPIVKSDLAKTVRKVLDEAKGSTQD